MPLEVPALALRYYLWTRGIPADRWPVTLAAWAGCDVERASQLLAGASVGSDELDRLSGFLSVQEEELQYGDDVLKGTDVLHENLKHLLRGSDRGVKVRLSQKVSVHKTTLSRWLSPDPAARIHPHPKTQREVARFFGIAADIDLSKDPLFLSDQPTSERELRKWFRDHVDLAPGAILRDLYPIVRRLLDGR